MKNSDNYNAIKKRITHASDMLALLRLEKSIDRLYNTGFFTVEEYRRLDNLICNRLEKLWEARSEKQ